MMYDAEDKYADIIRLPQLAFFKKSLPSHRGTITSLYGA